MTDWARIEGFDWDEGNIRKSTDKLGVSQTDAEQAFLNEPLLIMENRMHGGREPRFHALAQTDARRRLHITFTLRDENRLIRVISARPV